MLYSPRAFHSRTGFVGHFGARMETNEDFFPRCLLTSLAELDDPDCARGEVLVLSRVEVEDVTIVGHQHCGVAAAGTSPRRRAS